MTEEEFEQLVEEHDDAIAGGKGKPRVNLSYVNETEASRKVRSATFWPNLRARLKVTPDGLILAGKVFLVAVFILAYPVMTVLSHQLDDQPIRFDDSRYWAVPEIGVASVLIGRELDGPGWAADRHPWHPQARLTALPAWQEALLEAIAAHGRLIIRQLDDQRDPDLIAAIRLLDKAEGQQTTLRLLAASEALLRYDDRVAGGVTIAPTGQAAMIARLELAQQWANQERAALSAIASPGDGWIASKDAISAVYSAKATAHVAHELFAASLRDDKALLATYEIEDAFGDMLSKWRRAATLRPLFIANQSSDAASGINHPAIIGFHLEEARRAAANLAERLKAPSPEARNAPDAPARAPK